MKYVRIILLVLFGYFVWHFIIQNKPVVELSSNSEPKVFETLELPNQPNQMKMKLDDVMHVIVSIKSDKTVNNSKMIEITQWIDSLARNVNAISSRDLTNISNKFSNTPIFKLNDNIFSSDKDLRIDYENKINYVKDSFLLMIGDCEISFARDSVVICTGDVDIAHSSNNIIIANGEVEISHDGSGPEQLGSIIYTKNSVDISHSHSSAILFSPNIRISHVNNSYCINIGIFEASHGECNNIKSVYLIEDMTTQPIAELKIKKPENKTLNLDILEVSKDPVRVAEFFCQGIKQLNFNYSRNYLDSFLLKDFDKSTEENQHDLKKESKRTKIVKKLGKWSCENQQVNYSTNNYATIVVGGLGEVKLKKENDRWKIIKF